MSTSVLSVGDVFKYTGKSMRDLTSNKIYEVVSVDSEDSDYRVIDDVGENNWVNFRDAEMIAGAPVGPSIKVSVEGINSDLNCTASLTFESKEELSKYLGYVLSPTY